MLFDIILLLVLSVLYMSVLNFFVRLSESKAERRVLRGATRMSKDEYAMAWQRWNWRQRTSNNQCKSSPPRSNLIIDAK